MGCLLGCPYPGRVIVDAGALDVVRDDGDVVADTRDGGEVLAPIPAPRPVAPWSVAVTTGRPVLRWRLAPGTSAARIQLCRDRACTNVAHDVVVQGEQWLSPELERGMWFWRLWGRSGELEGAVGRTWQFFARTRHAGEPDGGAGTGVVGNAVATAIPDFDGDGRADVVVASAGRVFVYPGVVGNLPPALGATLTSPDESSEFGCGMSSAGDLDGDGFADLAVAAGVNNVYVYRGGDRGLEPRPERALQPASGQAFRDCNVVGAGDLDGDGYTDLAVATRGVTNAPEVRLARSAVVGDAGLPTIERLLRERAIGFGDFEGDGVSDFIAYDATYGGASYRWFDVYSAGRGAAQTLQPPREAGGPRSYEHDAVIDDVDGDGYVDLLGRVRSEGGGWYFHAGGVRGAEAVGTRLAITPEDVPGAVRGCGDVNGDGRGDIVARYPNECDILLDSLDRFGGTPGARRGYFVANGRSVAGVGDINGDRYDDILVFEGGRVSVLLGRATWSNTNPTVLSYGLPPPTSAPAWVAGVLHIY